jgi:hypothetical protein
LIAGAYGAFADGDVSTALGTLGSDIVWEVPGRNRVSGTYRGPAEVAALLRVIFELTEGTFRLQVQALLGGDGDVAATVTVWASRFGTQYSYDAVQLWKVVGDKAVRFKEYLSEQEVVDEIYR